MKYVPVFGRNIDSYIQKRLNNKTHLICTFDREDGLKLYILAIEINMRLEDNSLMPWGKYKGEKMANVPATYLMWLYNNEKCNAEVQAYIEDNMDALKGEIRQLGDKKDETKRYSKPIG